MGKPIKITEEEFKELVKKSGKTEAQLVKKEPEESKYSKKNIIEGGKLLKKSLIHAGTVAPYEYATKKLPKDVDKLKKAPKVALDTTRTILSFGAHFAPKDYTKHVTQNTATMYIPKERSRNGLRNEFTSRGYTGESGFPELDNRWSRATRTEAKGSLSIGKPISKGSLTTKGRISPSLNEMAPSLSLNTNVAMPNVRKIKGRKL